MSPSDAAFDADLYDGRSSARRRVSVQRDGARVRISGEDVLLDYGVDELRFRPRIGGLPLRIELPGNAVIVADAAQAAMVLPMTADAAWVHRLERHTGAVLGSLAGVILAAVLAVVYGVPWLAGHVAQALPPSVEAELADQGLKQLDRLVFHPSDFHAERREQLARVFAGLLVHAPGVESQLLFRNGGAIGPNAFALPGGDVLLTDQLVAAMDNDDLVAAVLAHEIGHVAHRHTTRHLLQSSFMALGSVLLLGDVSAVAGLAATVPTVLLHNAYSRDFEREADRFAFDLLQRAGRSPREFAQALTRLEDAASRHGGSDVPSFVSTHPSTKERVRAARDATP